MPAASAVPKPPPVLAGSAARAGVGVAAGREAPDDAEPPEAEPTVAGAPAPASVVADFGDVVLVGAAPEVPASLAAPTGEDEPDGRAEPALPDALADDPEALADGVAEDAPDLAALAGEAALDEAGVEGPEAGAPADLALLVPAVADAPLVLDAGRLADLAPLVAAPEAAALAGLAPPVPEPAEAAPPLVLDPAEAAAWPGVVPATAGAPVGVAGCLGTEDPADDVALTAEVPPMLGATPRTVAGTVPDAPTVVAGLASSPSAGFVSAAPAAGFLSASADFGGCGASGARPSSAANAATVPLPLLSLALLSLALLSLAFVEVYLTADDEPLLPLAELNPAAAEAAAGLVLDDAEGDGAAPGLAWAAGAAVALLASSAVPLAGLFLSPSVTGSAFRSIVWPRVLLGFERRGRLVIDLAPFSPDGRLRGSEPPRRTAPSLVLHSHRSRKQRSLQGRN
ncbi:hypothetical protein GTW51_12135 [Aurantimonas aggregata]|uniref:Uncharacterized protein n=1 Tax=Aurantimonas aggregata TaxID=2047720 RepID=A0A6L9MIE9_9HYPH|nr:hypothetical protein [Aurantimonas aggregata]NDV87448.1 hypothetical protein [Aurantimonas aggregata]